MVASLRSARNSLSTENPARLSSGNRFPVLQPDDSCVPFCVLLTRVKSAASQGRQLQDWFRWEAHFSFGPDWRSPGAVSMHGGRDDSGRRPLGFLRWERKIHYLKDKVIVNP